MQAENKEPVLAPVVSKLINLVVFLLFVIAGLTFILINCGSMHASIKRTSLKENSTDKEIRNSIVVSVAPDSTQYWKAPDLSDLKNESKKTQILYGRELIVNTSAYFGPKGKLHKMSTNGMNCQNCHLDGGTGIFANNYSAVASTYPKYRARSGTVEDIPKRVNDCFERSLNGRPLPINSKEMKAITAYIKWLGKDVKPGVKPPGSGLKKLAFLNRRANPENGKFVYTQKCQSCHLENGKGQLNADKSAYAYPPLWGENSYNNGAGLYRISNFARFVKYNMPLGATHNNAQLSDEEAWDVAAFVNSQARPGKVFRNDWPVISEKPFDHPFAPYADSYSEKEHKYGPYQTIVNAVPKQKN